MNRSTFLHLLTDDIIDIVKLQREPTVGLFVPDGNRRLVLAQTNLLENTIEFFKRLVSIQTASFRDNLIVFFSHGLPMLFAPLFSRSVLSRKSDYLTQVALKTLDILFNHDDWLEFYNTWNVRVKIYGDLLALNNSGCEQALPWINKIQEITKNHTSHTLFLGIGGEPWIGHDTARAAINFFQKYQREATIAELTEFLYGEPIPSADFFIMCSKFAGLGALPGFICNADTQAYYLSAPGAISLTQHTYRSILYDLLYLRKDNAGKDKYKLSPNQRSLLNGWYMKHANEVIGLGKKIGTVWVPEKTD